MLPDSRNLPNSNRIDEYLQAEYVHILSEALRLAGGNRDKLTDEIFEEAIRNYRLKLHEESQRELARDYDMIKERLDTEHEDHLSRWEGEEKQLKKRIFAMEEQVTELRELSQQRLDSKSVLENKLKEVTNQLEYTQRRLLEREQMFKSAEARRTEMFKDLVYTRGQLKQAQSDLIIAQQQPSKGALELATKIFVTTVSGLAFAYGVAQFAENVLRGNVILAILSALLVLCSLMALVAAELIDKKLAGSSGIAQADEELDGVLKVSQRNTSEPNTEIAQIDEAGLVQTDKTLAENQRQVEAGN